MSLPRLTALAEILRERELARLAAANRRAEALRGGIGALQAGVRQRAATLTALVDGARKADTPEPALAAGAEGRWLLWLSRERQALEQRYLLQLAEIEDLRAHSARAFGRAEVLRKLADSQRAEARKTRERRAAGPAPAGRRD